MVTLTKKRFKVYFHSQLVSELKAIKKSLKWLHPDAEKIPSFRDGRWDGIVRFYDMDRSFSVGLLHYVENALKEAEIDITYEGFDDHDVSWIKFSEGVSAEERDYQRNSILSFIKRRIGVIKVPTRGGKTYIAGETIRLLTEKWPNFNFLFLADSTDAFTQNIADLADFLGKTTKEIGHVKEKKREFKQVTVAMIQTIQSAMKSKDKEMMKYLASVNVVIIDEVHEYYSDARQKILKRIKKTVDFMLSISATPFKESDKIGSLNMEALTGGIVYNIHQKELEKRKVLAQNKVLLVINDIFSSETDLYETYFAVVENLIHNSEHRNNILKTLISVCDELGLKTLVMFASKKHGYKISEQTNKAFLCGDDDLATRMAVKKAFLEMDGEVLLVSQIWKKAITLPEVEVFVNADGGKEESLIIQKKGRVLGTTKTKTKALVIDIIDVCDEYFSEHSMSRVKVYEESNTEDEIDMMEHDSHFRENLTIYLNEWFNG